MNIRDSFFNYGFLSEMKMKKIKLDNVNFSNTDFFKTPLKGIDFSSCIIENIRVSDNYSELRGMQLSITQTMDIALIIGIKIK